MNAEQAKQVLDKMLTTSLNGCKKAMLAYGRIDHVILCVCGTPAAPEMIDFRNIEFNGQEGKSAFVVHLKERFKAEQAWGYLLALETWLTEGDDHNQKRHEAIIVAVIMPGYHCGVAAIFEREPGLTEKVIFTEEIPIEPSAELLGSFSTLLD